MDNGVTDRAPAPGESATREAANDGSRGSAPRLAGFRAAIGNAPRALLAVTAIGAVGAVLTILAEFTTITSVVQINTSDFSPPGAEEVVGGQCEVINDQDDALRDRCVLSGFERHGGALVLLGLVGLAMAFGAGLGGSRPAAVALVVVGLVVLGIGLLADLPETNETGEIGRNFEGARAEPGAGFYFELIGGALMAAAGALRLTQREQRPSTRPASSPPSA
jgi:hypothetical protein